ncbi:MAG TPA: hypothetical protein VK324_06770, partial [Tepidisphaeraceae bacterium]|nr:hypothetical protein [Tepidisphaeraceae bacterium]
MPDEDATNASPPVLAYARPHAAPDEQPPDSRLVLERDAGGLTLTDPPNRRAFVENLRFGLLLLTVGPAWLVGLWADATGGEWHVRDVISPLAVACVGAAIA